MITPHPGATVCSAFLAAEGSFGDRPFLRAPGDARHAPGRAVGKAVEFTYSSARREAERLHAGYQSLGIGMGDRVAIAFDSRLDVYLHLLALNALGASIVPLNMAGTDGEIGYVLDHSDARLITGATEHLERLRELAGKVKNIPVATVPATAPGHGLAQPAGGPDTEVALLYTSGTTGKPKGCMLSNEYFLIMGVEYNRLGKRCAIDSSDRLVTPLPPNHMNALSCSFMAMMLCGGCVIQLDRFHPATWWQTVREEAATVIHYLGVMPAILLQMEISALQGGENFGEQVKFGFGAGSDPRHQQAFERRFGFPLIEAWAMTETGGAAMIVAHEEPRLLGQRCIGRPGPGMELRIVDESDLDVAPGEPGELLVRRRGNHPREGFFSGYFKDAEATEDGWRGGWWHTGDVVRQDAGGSVFFVDRRKNIIRRSGENIAAVEVEAALLRQEAVGNCVVTAVPDEMRGDEVFAFVVTAGGAPPSEMLARQIFNSSRESLSYFKTPGWIAFVDRLPLTASQKISRAEVKKLAGEHMESGQAFDLRGLKTSKPGARP